MPPTEGDTTDGVSSRSSRLTTRQKSSRKAKRGSSSGSSPSDEGDSNSLDGKSAETVIDMPLGSKLRKEQRKKAKSQRKIAMGGMSKPKQDGEFRYLKPEQITQGALPDYDYAVIAKRTDTDTLSSTNVQRILQLVKLQPDEMEQTSSQVQSSEQEQEMQHRRIVSTLCAQGLNVDIIDGGHSKGEMNSEFLILLVHAQDRVVHSYVRSLRYELWRQHGSVVDMEQELMGTDTTPTPAERVQIVGDLIEQQADLSIHDRWIHDMFPMHNDKLTDKLMRRWIKSYRFILDDLQDTRVLSSLRNHFGEKVAYYFAFINYYNTALIPLALVGILMQILKSSIPTVGYMRLLPFWGLGVCVLWSFSFLKSWERRNVAMQYEWNGKIHVKQIEYPNKRFHGVSKVNALTNEVQLVYPAWRRLPKYLCVAVYMMAQIVIMLFLVAVWVTIYELLKATYPVSHIFSTQWFLILLEGIVFGLFVDVIQWNLVVTKMGRLFTHWENYRTEERYERALVYKLFLLDFLNYYTWFFSLAFVFVIPGFGNYLTNSLNSFFFRDPMNCCFGPYVTSEGTCSECPTGERDADCIECTGWFTFDRNHVDLSAMFVTPIIVTQSLNIALNVFTPMLVRWRRERAQARADAMAQQRVAETGSMKILGSLDYTDQESAHFGNKSSARYLEYTAEEIEVLNRKAREVLFDSEQDTYDPYNDFHVLTMQYGFTVMFSILWPLMPFACFLINTLKRRTDGYRLCKTLKRPIPRRANGIGAWKGVFKTYAYIAVIVNVLLICISTGALEFFDTACVEDIEKQLEKQGKTLDDFILGPDFRCMHVAWRLLIILVLEHVLLGGAYFFMMKVPKTPAWINDLMRARENQFKDLLSTHELQLFPLRREKDGDDESNDSSTEQVPLSKDLSPPRTASRSKWRLGRKNTSSDDKEYATPSVVEYEEPNSTGQRTKAREELAQQWSLEEDYL